MSDHIGRFRCGIEIIAAVGMFGLELTSLCAEVLRQPGTETAIGMAVAQRLSPEDARDRGSKLRAELDKAFNALPDSERAGHAGEFTAIALPYISAGTALEDAVSILKAAGFAEPPGPRARQEQDRDRDWYAIVAEIPQFSGRVFGNVDVYVMLLPPEQGLAEFAGRRHRLMYDPRP
jgi:hypothetical protein